jgi:hypothetical protein
MKSISQVSPKIGDLVVHCSEYPQKQYLVSAFIKRDEDPLDNPKRDSLVLQALLDLREQQRDRQKSLGLPFNNRFRYKFCSRENAGYIFGVLGTDEVVMSIEKSVVVGRAEEELVQILIEDSEVLLDSKDDLWDWQWE